MKARAVHPIETASYAILRARLDTSALPRYTRAVVERVVHASAEIGYFEDLEISDEADLAAAVDALAAGAPVVVDSRMLAAGVTSRPVVCGLAAGGRGPTGGGTRAAAGVRAAFDLVGPGAVWAIGTAPTALTELLSLPAAPTLVIGLPVGFIGAVAAKAQLRATGTPAVSNHSERGGAGVAAAALNALLYAGSR